jgi:hypothetical protein
MKIVKPWLGYDPPTPLIFYYFYYFVKGEFLIFPYFNQKNKGRTKKFLAIS